MEQIQPGLKHNRELHNICKFLYGRCSKLYTDYTYFTRNFPTSERFNFFNLGNFKTRILRWMLFLIKFFQVRTRQNFYVLHKYCRFFVDSTAGILNYLLKILVSITKCSFYLKHRKTWNVCGLEFQITVKKAYVNFNQCIAVIIFKLK